MQIKVKPFNEAPDAADLQAYLNRSHLSDLFEVADAKRQYWQNDHATLVLKLKAKDTRPSPNFEDGVALGSLCWRFNADEFDRTIEDYETFYRIWWD